MTRFNICIDIDGTVTEPFYWLKKANEFFKTQVEPQNITEYEIHEMLNIPEKDYVAFYNKHGVELHRDAELRLGANEMVSRLHQFHKVHFVTAREEKYTDVSIEWLQRYGFQFDTISHLGSHNKVGKANELESDFFIEDSHANAVQLSEAGFKVLLVNCYYNRKPIPPNVTRVVNWLEIVKIINEYDKSMTSEFMFA